MTQVSSSSSIGDVVDVERYPIEDLDSPSGRDLVQRCRTEFVDAVSCALPAFLRESAVRRLVSDVERLNDLQLEHSRLFDVVPEYAGLKRPKHHFMTHMTTAVPSADVVSYASRRH